MLKKIKKGTIFKNLGKNLENFKTFWKTAGDWKDPDIIHVNM